MKLIYTKLGDIITFKNGKKKPDEEGSIPIYGGNGILGYADKNNYKNCIIIGRVGAYCGSVYYEDNECWISDNAIVALPGENIDIYYAYYLLKELKLNQRHIGTSQPLLTQEILNKIECSIPELPVQGKISEILRTFDEKIETNNAINRNLSEQLQESFKHDYLEACEVHPEWEKTTLGELTSKFATGLNPRKNFILGHGNNYYVTIKNMGHNRIYLDEKCDRIDDEALKKINARSNLQVGDVLFSGIGTIGRTYLIDNPAINWNTSESVFNIRPNDKITSEFLYLLMLSDQMQDYAITNASGSVQKGIRMADLKKYSVICPDMSFMKINSDKWKILIAKIKSCEKENDYLSILRDTLLPKLMSGELDVSDLDI